MQRNTLSSFFKKDQVVSSNSNKLLLIDGHNLVFRTIFVAAAVAKRDMLTDNELYDYWRYLMLNNIFNLIKDFKPSRVVMTIDGRDNWRKDVYKEYKAKRKVDRDSNMSIDFKTFWPIMDEFISSFTNIFKNIIILQIDRCEGDDIIAILAKQEMKNGEVVIITSDKDFIQLLQYKNISLYNPIKRKLVKSVDPKKDLELKIISGDKSDGVPAIKPKCGLKTAEKMIKSGIDIYLQNETIKLNYERNKKLIDFEFIPTDIQSLIINNYQKYQVSEIDRKKVFGFLTSCNVSKILENFNQYSTHLNNLK